MLSWLVISQLVAVASLVPWFVLVGIIGIAFDWVVRFKAWIIVGALWAYPVLPICCGVLAWRFYFSAQPVAALISTSLPLVLALPLLAYQVYIHS